MRGTSVPYGHYHVGQRVVAGRGMRHDLKGGRSFEDLRVERIESIDDDARRHGYNARMTLRHGDEVRTVLLCNASINDTEIEKQPWKTLWTEPLPENEHAAIQMVAAVYAADRQRDVALLWIGAAVGDGKAYAHLVTDRYEAGDGVVPGDEAVPSERGAMGYMPHAVMVQSDEPLTPNTLVAATLALAYEMDGIAVHRIERPRVILSEVGLKQAAAALPVAARLKSHYSHANFAGAYEISEREERAHAASQPSQALVLCWKDGDTQYVKCIGSSGIAFHNNDDPEAYADAQVDGPGLWMWTDVSWQGYTDHEGGYDADMDGDWAPATPDDVRKMFGSMDDLSGEIVEYTSEDPEMCMAERYIAMAQETARIEREAHDRRLAERQALLENIAGGSKV